MNALFSYFSRGHKAQLSGWGRQYVDAGCGYAWFDKDSNEWLHTPPKTVDGNVLSSVEVKILEDSQAREVNYETNHHWVLC